MNLLILTQIVFIILKLTAAIAWGWMIVLIPLWICLFLIILGFVIGIVLGILLLLLPDSASSSLQSSIQEHLRYRRANSK